MAIATHNERMSLIGLMLPFNTMVPSSAINEASRRMLLNLYAFGDDDEGGGGEESGTTQQGLRQADYRILADVSVGTYNENLFAAAEATVPGGVVGLTIAGAEIKLLQTLLGSSQQDLSGLKAEYAEAIDAANWSSVGDIEDQT